MPSLTPEKRARILVLLEEKYPAREIARREKIQPSTVLRIRKRWQKTQSCQDARRTGRPRAVSERGERQIARLVTSGQCHTAVDTQQLLRESEGEAVSSRTVRRIFRRIGLVARVKRRKPLLQKRHLQARLCFAKKCANWTVVDWRRVIYSDESKFTIFGSGRRQHCWVKPGAPLSTAHVQPTAKHGGGSIMVWGCLTSQGVGNLCRIIGGLDAELYCRILGDDLKGTLSYYHFNPSEVTFQHDNDPKHTAKRTKRWLGDNHIRVLDWPAQSPDLNPMEHLWEEVKRRMSNLSKKPRSKDELWDRLQDVWNGIEPSVCAKLVDSMPARIQAVLDAKGGYTRY